jgi:hypothetical protein
MAWVPQVNGHVQVFYVSGSKIKVRPGVITGIVVGDTVNVRIGHFTPTQTFASLTRKTSTVGTPTYPCYTAM